MEHIRYCVLFRQADISIRKANEFSYPRPLSDDNVVELSPRLHPGKSRSPDLMPDIEVATFAGGDANSTILLSVEGYTGHRETC